MLRQISCISLLFLFLFSGSGYAQTSNRLKSAWDSFRNSDDNEKDFRFNSFLKLLEQSIEEKTGIIPESDFLGGWKVVDNSDKNYSIYTTYVDFEIRPDRLIYCIYNSERNQAVAHFKEVVESQDEIDLSIVLESLDNVTSLVVLNSREELLHIPDLEVVFVLNEMIQSRGRGIVFSLSDSLKSRIELLIQNSSTFDNDFADYQGLSTLISSDDKLKVVTWNVEERNGDHHLYGVIGVKNENVVRAYSLDDKSGEIPTPEYAVLKPEKWFGAVYYELITEAFKGDVFYTLLGYNGNDAFSRIRVVDVITLSKSGRPRFGALIFDDHGRTKRRLIYEYSNQANMMLRYENRGNRIVMDHLAPLQPMYEGDRSYYGPDFSYDVLELKKGKWILEKNVELRNR
ncbi:hypothetical protein [Marinilabilia sp.]|uniref:hypothetical protein n=1 Tax=Marinilabilia sp. TaxID=2021252 RepID=UPI0025C24FD2|nr:hypothetical protein [Marinilabilia sp.]